MSIYLTIPRYFTWFTHFHPVHRFMKQNLCSPFFEAIFFRLMVNQADCTKNVFDFLPIHIIHRSLYTLPPKLSTSQFVHFKAKNSYTPTYPHYPQVYNFSFALPPQTLHLFYFCTLLINLKSTKEKTRFSLDISRSPLLGMQ